MESATDRKIRLLGPLLLFLLGTLFFRLKWFFEMPTWELIRSNLIGLSAGYVCWNVARWVVRKLQKHYPGLENTRRRLLWMTLLLPVLVNFAWLLRRFLHFAFHNIDSIGITLPAYTYALGIQIFYHCVYYAIYEGEYLLREWRQSYEQNEWLKKNQLKHQLDTLKSQLNPHFLFNSLNSLSMLIQENPRQAEVFVDEISNVYRYLLRANRIDWFAGAEPDPSVTTLRRELQFIQSYFHLLRTRYGAGIELWVSVENRYLELKMPPLTLQLLLENAVKHNVVLPETPLIVRIEARNNELVVRNNLQRKNAAAYSNRVGLANIAAKYRLLNGQSIVLSEEDGDFVVTLPLLATQSLTHPGQ